MIKVCKTLTYEYRYNLVNNCNEPRAVATIGARGQLPPPPNRYCPPHQTFGKLKTMKNISIYDSFETFRNLRNVKVLGLRPRTPFYVVFIWYINCIILCFKSTKLNLALPQTG